VEWTSEEKNKVGSTVHIYVEAGGMKAELDYETTEIIENEKVAFRSIGKNFKAIGFHGLTPTENGTKVTIDATYELPYSVLGKLIDKLRFRKAMEKSFEAGLKKLKDMMEKWELPRLLSQIKRFHLFFILCFRIADKNANDQPSISLPSGL
jgi:uncharacterized membrane protein